MSLGEFSSEFNSESHLKKSISQECKVSEDGFSIGVEPDGVDKCFLSMKFPSPDAGVFSRLSMTTLGNACRLDPDQIFTISFQMVK
jgi:hypothetical protein